MPHRKAPFSPKGYFISLVLFFAAALSLFKFEFLQTKGSGPLLLGVVFVASIIGTWRAGLMVALLSSLLLIWFYQPANSIRITDLHDIIRLTIFMCMATMFVTLLYSRERALRRATISEQRLAAALTAARMGGWDKDLLSGAFWWSPGLEEIFGRRPGTFVDAYDDFLGYIHPEDRGFVSNAFTTSVERGTEFEIEHRIVRPDHDIRWIITRGRIIFDASGKPERLLGIAVDVTDRRSSLPTDPLLGSSSPPEADVLTPLPGRL